MKLQVEKLIYEGWGIGRDENDRAVFVKKSVPGDLLEVSITKEKKTYAEAVIENIIKPSPQRIEPDCPYFNLCGGCEHQNIAYSDQLIFKEAIFHETLARQGIETEILPIMQASEPFYYRNSIRFFLLEKENGEKIFTRHNYRYEKGFVEAEKCLLQSEKSNEILAAILEVLNNSDEKLGSLYQVKIREGKFTGDFMIEVFTDSDDLPFETELKKELTAICEIKSLFHTITYGRSLNNVKRRLLFGSPIIYEKIGKFTFQISPDSFFQTNSLGVKTLYDKIKEFAAIGIGDRVLDLYCGTGTIGIYLSTLAKSVTGVESVQSAVNDARANAKINNVANAEFICADAGKWLKQYSASTIEKSKSPRQASNNKSLGDNSISINSVYSSSADNASSSSSNNIYSSSEVEKYDKIILDPPRAGLNKEMIKSVYELSNLIKFQLIYVSCNPATFARDVKEFEKTGLKLKKVQPLDMFPQTHHIECVGMF